MIVHYVYLVWYYIGDNEALIDIFEEEKDAINHVLTNEVFKMFGGFEKVENKLAWVYGNRQFIIEKWQVK